MSKPLKILFGSIATFLLIVILSVIYLMIGASTFGPKTEVSAVCDSLTSGMDVEAVTALTDQYEGMDIFASDDERYFQISKVSGGWNCICQATLAGEGSNNSQGASVDKELFCVD